MSDFEDDFDDELSRVLLAYRQHHSHEKARELLVKFGADPKHVNLGTVPAKRIPDLLRALKGQPPVAKRVMSIGEVHQALGDLHANAYRKWNFGYRRPAR